MEEDIKLIEQIRSGNDAAFSSLVSKYRHMIYKIIYSCHLDNGDYRYDEDDLFQEGCLALYKCVFSFEEDRNVRFSTYAYMIIRSKVKENLRAAARGRSEGIYSLEKASQHDLKDLVCCDPLKYHHEEQVKEELKIFFKELSDEDRQILTMKEQEYSYKQICERLSIDRKRVDNRIRFLKKRLKKQLNENCL